MNTQPSVTVSLVEGHHALRLSWRRRVIEGDVRPAFHKLTALLDEATRPVHVIVDLSEDPQLPLATTKSETLLGPFMHPMMGEWLVIGSNKRAEVVARTITRVGRRQNIHWFASEDEALKYLANLETSQASGRIDAFEGFEAGHRADAPSEKTTDY